MSNKDRRNSRTRRFFSGMLDLGIAAGIGFALMWPLGVFEGEAAYVRNQIILRILGLILGGFVLANGWLLLKHGQTFGRKVYGIPSRANPDPAYVAVWKLFIRTTLLLILAASPFIALVINLFFLR